jgi:hypothetical protein
VGSRMSWRKSQGTLDGWALLHAGQPLDHVGSCIRVACPRRSSWCLAMQCSQLLA